MEVSALAKRLTENRGIRSLMEDLGKVSGRTDVIRLGGGNPAHIPEAETIFEECFLKLSKSPKLKSLLGDYQSPIGNDSIRELTAEYLSPYLNYTLAKNNIAFFNGSQNAFSYALNLYTGRMEDGKTSKILLPLVPEYIGYADQTIESNGFTAFPPLVQTTNQHRFLYKLNKTRLENADFGAILISNPTNPTGNVFSEEDLDYLQMVAKNRSLPFIIDLAYGAPFPALIGDAKPVHYKEGRILSLSFSKVGLPGVRLGIIVSDSFTIERLTSFASMGNLAVGNLGIYLAEIFFREDSLVKLANNTLRPYYEKKKLLALDLFETAFQTHDIDYEIHEPLGGFFIWIRFPSLRISNQDLYEICKRENLYFVSGHYFFPGLDEEFSHTRECIRLTYSAGEEELANGARLLANILAKYQAN
ncbi:MAG: valine--pyruvate transaminase [Leptospira sp.]|nr:valine--pyruvate transaminase [Leptospira sp.]